MILIVVIVVFIIVLIIISLWLYSKALKLSIFNSNNNNIYCYRCNDDNDNSNNVNTIADSVFMRNPIIHKPFLGNNGKKGSLNLNEIQENEWLEFDNHTIRIMNLCEVEMKRSESTFAIAKGYEDRVLDASLELLDTVINHINKNTKRSYINRTNNIIKNEITDRIYDISEKHPLVVVRLLIGEDVVIMMKNNENIHVLAAAVIVFPDNWKLEHKIGLPLAAIHYPVNALNTKNESINLFTNPSSSPIIRAMEYFFDKLYSNSNPVTYSRFNWAFQNHDHLTNRFYDVWSIYGEHLRELASICFNDETELYIRGYIRELLSKISLIFTPDKCHILLRTERQTLKLLPSSSAVAFLVRTLVTPLDKVINNRDEAITLINALQNDVPINDNSSKGEFRNEIINLLSNKYSL